MVYIKDLAVFYLNNMKYILLTGGEDSVTDKSVVAKSIAGILKKNGFEVTTIKIDPYAGVFSSCEQGYDSIHTLGKIYEDVINRERKGTFLGRTVQVVPHITDAIQKCVDKAASIPACNGANPEICVIELGDITGDIESMSTVEAFRQFQHRVKKENFCCVHVCEIFQLKSVGEPKTKPTQVSVKKIRSMGLSPDLIVCRSENPIDKAVKEKISHFCDVSPEQVMCLHDAKMVYNVSMSLEEQKLVEFFLKRLILPFKIKMLVNFLSRRWGKLYSRIALTADNSGLKDCGSPQKKSLQPKTVEWRLKSNLESNMKYILVTGGVISGIGKGVVSSSIGKIFKNHGYEVTAIKIDPYINSDAGTISPYEHGEVYVLDDGGEVDLDLGNYERFIEIELHSDNSITTGKIYQDIFDREKRGEFLHQNVRIIPHVTNAIQEWIERVALKPVTNCGNPEICIIELGGTIGDIESMPFYEALGRLKFRVRKENFCCVHVSLVDQSKSTGEHKIKKTYDSVKKLRSLNLSPDLVVCRSENPFNEVVKSKISNLCLVAPEQVICLYDVKSVFHVPVFMEEQKLVEFFHQRLQLPYRSQNLSEENVNLSRKWRKFVQTMDHHTNEVKIALVGKYTGLKDSYASVIKALQHAAIKCDLKLNLKFIAALDLEPSTLEKDSDCYQEAWQELKESDGVIVPGGFGFSGVEGKITAIEWARKNRIPFLGVCLGFQLAVVEFARNVVGWKDAQSYEMSQDNSKKNVVIEMPECNTGVMGGTMRLGKKLTVFKTEDSILRALYKEKVIKERHRHRYEVDKVYAPEFEKAGMKFVAEDESGERLEILELSDHPYFVAVQFHPEYLSRPLDPSPPYLGLILASCNKLKYVLEKEY